MKKLFNGANVYLKFYFRILVIFFILLIFQNKNYFIAEENTKKCLDLISPKDLIELKKLRLCIKKIKSSQELEKENQIIMNAFDGSKKLTKKIENSKKPINLVTN